MKVLTGSLFAASLLCALCIQHNLSFMAGLWLLPFLACCLIMLGTQEKKIRGIVWVCSLLWLITIGLATFLITPVHSGAATGWTLAAAPMLAVTAAPKHLRTLLIASIGSITLYATCLVSLALLRVHYSAFSYVSHFSWALPAWPLIDPNNAACIMVVGFMLASDQGFSGTHYPRIYALSAGLCLCALLLTESKAGALALGCAALLVAHQKLQRTTFFFAAITLFFAAWMIAPFCSFASLAPRIAMIKDSWPLLWMHPWRGIGLGMFKVYYAGVRKETLSGGYFAHNDFYQMTLEMGLPCAAVLLALIASVIAARRPENLMSTCVLLAVAIMASLEFQLYLQSVSLLTGLALAYHNIRGTTTATQRELRQSVSPARSRGFYLPVHTDL